MAPAKRVHPADHVALAGSPTRGVETEGADERPQRLPGGRPDAKDVGLEIALLFGRFFLGTEHLHYGYWPEGLDADVRNLARAQELYAELLASHVPAGVKTVLDVGCGSGRLALLLSEKGYRVDCVSPSPFLTRRARELLGGRSRVFECKFEDLRTDVRRYDLVMFSESFQYIDMDAALRGALSLLADGGHVLISDFFRTGAPGRSPLGGGHLLAEFRARAAALPLDPVVDLDITRETAPNLAIVEAMMERVLRPAWASVAAFLRAGHPVLFRILAWRLRRKLERLRFQFLSGERNARNFALHKSYRLMLFRKAAPGRLLP